MKSLEKINNLKDLRAEIAYLRLRRSEQEAYLSDQYKLLKTKMDMPFEVLRRVTAYVPGVGMLRGVTSSVSKAFKSKDADWLTRLLQMGAPIILSSTLLRRSGWFKKAMVLLASETAIGQLNQDKVSGLVDKITAFIKPQKKKRKKKEVEPILEDHRAATQTPVVEDEEQSLG